MNKHLEIQVGNYSEVFGQCSATESLYMILESIRSSSFLSSSVNRLQALKAGGFSEDARKFKLRMPCVTFSAVAYGERKVENITQYNRLLVLDFDHIPKQNYDDVRNAILEDPHTFCVFKSPSGDGLKVLVKIDTDLEFHKTAFQEVNAYYESITGFEPDKSGSDPLRLCILSYDPDLYINEDPAIYKVDTTDQIKSKRQASMQKIKEGNYPKLFEFILHETTAEESYQEGNRNNFIHRFACNLNRGGIPEEMAMEYSIYKFNDCSPSEIASVINGVYQRNKTEFATVDYEVKLLTRPKDDESYLNTPVLPAAMYETLPPLIRTQCRLFSDPRERDVFFVSMLGILSGSLNRVFGVYRGKTVFPNLFFYVVAPAGSNKGVMEFARLIGVKYHKHLLAVSDEAEAAYKQKLEQYNLDKKNGVAGELPESPNIRKFYIPGNSSSSAMLRQIRENEGAGIICESEGDTIGNMFKQDWGNFSEIFRKAFHHEYLSINRKEREDCHEIENVKLSVIITSTPDQVTSIIQSANNGLFSRMGFYLFSTPANWVDMDLTEEDFSLSDHFKAVGASLMEMIEHFSVLDTKIVLQPSHKEMINTFGRHWMTEVAAFVDDEATAVVKRFGLILFRICIILTAVRHYGDDLPIASELVCHDQDAENALKITETLIQHSLAMFKMLPQNGNTEVNARMRLFYDLLPDYFSRKESLQTAARLGLKTTTTDKYLSRLQKHNYLRQPKYGFYEKANRANCEKYANYETGTNATF